MLRREIDYGFVAADLAQIVGECFGEFLRAL
jgi:hypothetical protein